MHTSSVKWPGTTPVSALLPNLYDVVRSSGPKQYRKMLQHLRASRRLVRS